ncbi:hypothetical protein [Liquorilactobacillus hordei]|uniref:hypothetical protein n=1 Tax=Liquorilactobacillus hordei TaxID=468911 RepID=UPI001CBF2387|nr:hypothetical protein [Liquorilactobacillus hordei]MBZ2406628.1 hypothetical protein [Liquorilactobacillus hordei]
MKYLKADSRLIEWLINSDESAYKIAKDLNQGRAKISNLRTGKVAVENILFSQANTLTEYADEKWKNQLKKAINSFENKKRYYSSESKKYGGTVNIWIKRKIIHDLIQDIPEYVKMSFDEDYQPKLNTTFSSYEKAINNLEMLLEGSDTEFIVSFCEEKGNNLTIYHLSKNGITEALEKEEWLSKNAKADLKSLKNELPDELN